MATECDHEYVEVPDAEGDLSEARLTHEFSWWCCIHCGDEQSERPEEKFIYEPDYEAIKESLQWD